MPDAAMPPDVKAYMEGVAPEWRPLFRRLHRLVVRACPRVQIGISYQMPAYRLGNRTLFLAAWQHGVSIYGWQAARDGGFTSRHAALVSGKGTIRVRPEDAAQISDEEFVGLILETLAP